MASIYIKEQFAALSGNGDSSGYVYVTDNSLFYPGAKATLISSAAPSRECVVTDLKGSTGVGLRFMPHLDANGNIPPPSYPGRSDCSTYLVADGATIYQLSQAVQIQPAFSKFTAV